VRPGPIRAAGGVVWRDDGTLRIALIYRARYDDWTLPKGKLEHGERELDAAVREVREETGATVAVTRRLLAIEYTVSAGRGGTDHPGNDIPKTVQFWAMRYLSGEFSASAEVDDLVWLPLDDARHRLTHVVDRAVLDSFTARPVPQSVVVLVRHAKAGKRSHWMAMTGCARWTRPDVVRRAVSRRSCRRSRRRGWCQPTGRDACRPSSRSRTPAAWTSRSPRRSPTRPTSSVRMGHGRAARDRESHAGCGDLQPGHRRAGPRR